MANTFELIQATTLGSTQSSISFTVIPSTYTDLSVRISARSTAGGGTNWDALLYRLNSATSGYSTRNLVGAGSGTPYSSSLTTATSTAASGTWGRLMDYGIDTSNQTANTFTSIDIYIPNYAGSTQKSLSMEYAYETNATAAYMEMVAGLYTGTSAITQIDLALITGSFAANSTAYLYGVKNA